MAKDLHYLMKKQKKTLPYCDVCDKKVPSWTMHPIN